MWNFIYRLCKMFIMSRASSPVTKLGKNAWNGYKTPHTYIVFLQIWAYITRHRFVSPIVSIALNFDGREYVIHYLYTHSYLYIYMTHKTHRVLSPPSPYHITDMKSCCARYFMVVLLNEAQGDALIRLSASMFADVNFHSLTHWPLVDFNFIFDRQFSG